MDMSEWINSEEVQKHFKKASGVVVSAVYNEVYLYLWFICIYNIFLLIVVVANMYLLMRLIRVSNVKLYDVVVQ